MPYRIKKPHRLGETEIADIHGIVSLCNEHDNATYAFDADDDLKKGSDINNFLLYDNARLLSVINLFVPMRHEAEATAFTLPQFRRSGLYDQNIIGMIGIYRGEKQNTIHGFCIEEKYRNRGFGSRALNYIAREYSILEPEKDLELEVQVDNAGALSLYRKTGFDVVAAYDYSRLQATTGVH